MEPAPPEAVPLDVPSDRGEALSGILHAPAGEPRGLAILSPCFTCTRDVAPVRSLARDLAAAGFLAYRFDPAGSGKSQGRFEDATVSRYRSDLLTVARALEKRPGARGLPLHLAGHSLGGVVSILAASEAGAASLVTLATDARKDAFRRLFGPDHDRALSRGAIEFDAGDGVRRSLSREFLLDFEAQDVLGAAERRGGPLLAIHGDQDEVVPADASRELVARAGPRARLAIVPGGAHLLSRKEDRARIREAVLLFLSRELAP